MLRGLRILVAIVAVLGCADAPTEARGATEMGVFRSMTTVSATPSGQILQVAIPDVGAVLLPDEVLVATGRSGSVDISDCDGNMLTAARYAVLTSARSTSHNKVHLSTDVEAGTKMSRLQHLASCTIGGTAYEVYQVETQ